MIFFIYIQVCDKRDPWLYFVCAGMMKFHSNVGSMAPGYKVTKCIAEIRKGSMRIVARAPPQNG
jgi:hypothetical protein